MTVLEDPMVEDYLQQVADALRAAEPERRNDILEQIADHIVAATADLQPVDQATLAAVLDRLGPPSDIAAAADVAPFGLPSPGPSTADRAPNPTSERLALAAFALSPLLPFLGWIVGCVLLWTSRTWTPRHKVVGALTTLPLSVAVIALVAGGPMASTDPGNFLVLLGIWGVVGVMPVVAIVWLARAIPGRGRRAA